MEKKALGKGIGALLPPKESVWGKAHQQVEAIALTHIGPNRFQPRKDFPLSDLEPLADSIKHNGVLQPILVRRLGDGNYELIAGERRLRAAKLAGLTSIPAIVRNSTDDQSASFSLVENIQRQDLNPMEEARAYSRLMNEFQLTQEEVGERVGKDRSTIANISRLMSLPKTVQEFVELGSVSLGHAKVLLGLSHAPTQVEIANQIIKENLSVRQTEQLLLNRIKKRVRKNQIVKESAFQHVEEQFRKRLGTKTVIRKGRRGGKIEISFFTEEDLNRVAEIILS